VNIVSIIQARVSSSRLPNKVLMDVMGSPMLARQIERMIRVKSLENLVVATSNHNEDNAIEDMCREIGIDCYRGSLDDVLDRFYRCAEKYSPEHVVRITGDCPLIDPDIIDRVVSFHLENGHDYTSNVLAPTWPDGMDVEVMRFRCLAEAHEEATAPSEREHVTSFIYKHPERFNLGSVTQTEDLSSIRLTVDEPEDFELVCKIYHYLYPHNPTFGLDDVMNLLHETPELMGLNKKFERNEGLRQSEQKDLQYFDANE